MKLNNLRNHLSILFPSILLIILSGCSGDGIGGTGIDTNGIGGTGIGTVSGFSSVIINSDKVFDVGPDTQLFIDGVLVSEETFRQLGLGFVAEYQIANDANVNLTSGTLIALKATNYLRGPVTSTNPLSVLDQVTLTGTDTVVQGTVVNELQQGDFVEVSGFADNNNTVRVKRLKTITAADQWKLTGIVSNLIANDRFSIGTQTIVLNGVVAENCGDSLNNGDLVEVSATSTNDFVPGGVINTVEEVECKQSGLDIPDNTTEPIESEFEGIVTQVQSSTDFIIGGQLVRINSNTEFEKGVIADLVVGTLVEVKGLLNPLTSILDAEKIEFEEAGEENEEEESNDNDSDGSDDSAEEEENESNDNDVDESDDSAEDSESDN